MDSEDLLAIAVSAAFLGLFALLSRWWTRRSRLSSRRVILIERAQDGRLVTICGELSSGPLVRAPISGAQCLAYETQVLRQVQENDNVRWELHVKEESLGRLRLVDASGQAEFDRGLTTLHCPKADWNEGLTKTAAEFIAAKGETTNAILKWRECVLMAGASVRVRGLARRQAAFSSSIVLEAPEQGWIEMEPCDPGGRGEHGEWVAGTR